MLIFFLLLEIINELETFEIKSFLLSREIPSILELSSLHPQVFLSLGLESPLSHSWLCCDSLSHLTRIKLSDIIPRCVFQ